MLWATALQTASVRFSDSGNATMQPNLISAELLSWSVWVTLQDLLTVLPWWMEVSEALRHQ